MTDEHGRSDGADEIPEGASATEPAAPPDEPWFLTVDGIDGSGKSILADCWARALEARGMEVARLRVDDFRRAVDWRATARAPADMYYDDYFELAALNDAVGALLAGAPEVTVPIFDSSVEQRTGDRVVRLDHARPRAILLEGVLALRLERVRAAATFVYLQTSFEEARRRIVARDTARGRPAADVLHRIESRYFPAQARYIRDHAPTLRADVLIEHERVGVPALVRLDPARVPPLVEKTLESALADFARVASVK